MSTRTTQKELEALADWLNKVTNNPTESYVKDEAGKMMNDGGGVTDIFGCGHMPKKELAARIRSYARGIEVGKDL